MSTLRRIPSDLDRADELLFGMSLPQLGITALGVTLGAGMFFAFRSILPVLPLAFVCAVVAVCAYAVATSKMSGAVGLAQISGLVTHFSTAKTIVPEGRMGLPRRLRWARDQRRLGSLSLPAKGFTRTGDLVLGRKLYARIVSVSSLDFALRLEPEQEQLVESLGRWLNSLDYTPQILVRAEQVDLTPQADLVGVRAFPTGLGLLADAHAAHLRSLSGGVRRVAYVVIPGSGPDELATREGSLDKHLRPAGLRTRRLTPSESLALVASAMGQDPPQEGEAYPSEPIRRLA